MEVVFKTNDYLLAWYLLFKPSTDTEFQKIKSKKIYSKLKKYIFEGKFPYEIKEQEKIFKTENLSLD